jgi:hypothetical protein
MSPHSTADQVKEQTMNPLSYSISRYFRRPSLEHGRSRAGLRKARRGTAKPRLELLEDRTVPAYVVTTTADGGTGSLRDAITQINLDTNHTLYASAGNPSVDEIDFAITAASDVAGGGTGFSTLTGVATITPQTSLPAITNAVLIDGYTQAGSSGNTNTFGSADNAVLKVELNGAAAGNANGLVVFAPNSTVRGLVINSFAGYGLYVGGAASGNDWVYGNFIGVDPTGMANEGNQSGIVVDTTNNVTIGSKADGHDALERNLISGNGGNSGAGIFVNNSQSVTIQGNYVGTDATGSGQFNFVHNGDFNIKAYSDSNLNIIGNVVSGGAYFGILLSYNTSQAVIQGNRIGTNAAGTQALGPPPSGAAGIWVDGGCNNVLIGGVDTNTPGAALTGAGNLVSGNDDGIKVMNSNGITVQGNYVGTDLTGKYAIPNSNNGVGGNSQNVTIGGITPGAGNLISGNALGGISIGGSAGPVLIEGNTIGTDATGSYAIANSGGVGVSASSGVTIGGTTGAARNVISGNTGDGVQIGSGTGNAILGNSIHDNGGLGINLTSGANDSQAAPVLTAVSSSGAGTAISGTLASVASTTFRIEFFSNQSPDPSGYGEGQTYLGFATVTTDGSGNASFNTTLAGHVPLGQRYLSATATNLSTNDTSAFAKDLFVPFNFSGFLPPLSQNLAFGLNRTIPIKFQLTDVDGSVITSLGAVTSLQVAPVLSGGGLGTPFAPTASGGTGLRNDGTQYTFNWQTKGLTAGSYEILLTLSDGSVKTKVIQLSANGKAGALLIDGSTTTAAAGSLLGGNIDLYVDNTNGDLTPDELARIQDAATAADAVTEPYGVAVTEVTDPTLADVTLNMDTTSAVGGYAAGVLGCTTDAGQITIINGWNFYAGSDATQIGSAQYDFETVVTHELGHALGLGHSTDSTSVMYATLNTGAVNRTLTAADLNVPDSDTTGACGLHVAIEVGRVSNPSYDEAGRDAVFALFGNGPSASSVNQIAQPPAERNVAAILPRSMEAVPILAARSDAVFASSQREADDVLTDMALLPEEDVAVTIE